MPDRAAGCRIDPPVSVPVAAGTRRAATADAEPPPQARGHQHVLVGDGNASERATVTRGAARVGGLGLLERAGTVDSDERVELRAERLDPVKQSAGELDARESPRAQRLGKLGDGCGQHGLKR